MTDLKQYANAKNANYARSRRMDRVKIGPVKGGTGTHVWLEPDEIRLIPNELIPALLAAGGEILDEAEKVVPPPPAPEISDEQEQLAQLVTACQNLILTNEVRDFTRTGRPRIESVRNLVDFEVTADALRIAYEEALNRNQSDGDTGTEHTE